MKLTIDLPDTLICEIERFSLRDGGPLSEVIEKLLRIGLAANRGTNVSSPVIKSDLRTGLPYIECKQSNPSGDELTPGRVAEFLIDQEVAWLNEAGG